jgi:hypothetical protein
MKRRIFALLTGALLLLSVASCADDINQNDVTGKPPNESSSPAGSAVEKPSPSIEPTPESSVPEESVEPTPELSEEPTSDQGEETQPENMTNPEFSFLISSMMLALRQRDVEDELASIHLKKISDNTQTLGPDSDTFNGSYLRTVTYEGFEIDLFAPKDDSENFWIMRMTAISSVGDISTFRNVRVGDTAKTLTDKYPEAEQFEEGVYTYRDEEADDPLLNELTFTVEYGVITKIQMTFYLP